MSTDARGNAAPIACTLGPDDLRQRLQQISDLTARYLRAQVREGRTLHLRYDVQAAAELRTLVAQEQQCCAFLDFDLLEVNGEVLLSITAPAEASEFASLLLDHFVAKQPHVAMQCCVPAAACGC
jgi:hypothetical protein